ncbi:MAG: FAD-binding oxidoreductase [Anaerolineae bacterium]
MSYDSKTAGNGALSVAQLRAAVTGRVITPEDSDYDQARTVFYGGIDRRPIAIVRAADANDVARVVSLARETGIELAVRGGGHSASGHGVTEGGVVLDLSPMKSLDFDLEHRTVWAGAGVTAGEYTTAAAAHGLATGFGDTGSVGIGGITLGGGIGYLARKYGLTIDSLLAAEVVTADGKRVYTDAETNPDLFWAIRGGGGNFGVVTRLQFRLSEVPSIYGGMLILPATPETLSAFLEAADAAPDELTTIANVMVAPPMPFVPPEAHGKLIIMGTLVYAGDAEAGQRVIAPFRALATPIVDMIRPMSYAELYPPEAEGYHPVAAARTMFIDHFDTAMAADLIHRLTTAKAMMAVSQIRVLGGAVSRIPADSTAYAHRNRRLMVNVAALYNNPAERPTHDAWAADFAAALQQGTTGAYVNFLGPDGTSRIREAYPGDVWERLRAVKAKYDPTNLFHLNQNIPPAGDSSRQPEPDRASTGETR